MSFPDVMTFDRWLSERAAREYVRTGELALTRIYHDMLPQRRSQLQFWVSLLPRVAELSVKLKEALASRGASVFKINEAVFEKFEALIKLLI